MQCRGVYLEPHWLARLTNRPIHTQLLINIDRSVCLGVLLTRLILPFKLTSHKHFKLFVIELHFLLGDPAALSTLPDRVNKAHPGKSHLLTAALITETPATPPAVVLNNRTGEGMQRE